MKRSITLIIFLFGWFLLCHILYATSLDNNIKLYGDFRYRHEMIDEEGKDTRNRQRIRTRLFLCYEIDNRLKLNFRFATGSNNPTSTNQSLDEGFSTKNIGLDLAYFEWNVLETKKMTITGGKVKNPFYLPGRTELIWDTDLNPEGLTLKYIRIFEDMEIFVNCGSFWVEERSNDKDSFLLGIQPGLKMMTGEDAALRLAGGYFTFTEAKKNKPFFDPNNSFGNSIDTNGNYSEDYNEVEFFIEYEFKYEGINASVFGDYVTNKGADDDNIGWLMGFKIRNIGKPVKWEWRYNYRKIEKDGVVGIYTDSNFAGGGTDGRGHEFGFKYFVDEHTDWGFTYFLNDMGLKNGKGYKRLQVDLQFKF